MTVGNHSDHSCRQSINSMVRFPGLRDAVSPLGGGAKLLGCVCGDVMLKYASTSTID